MSEMPINQPLEIELAEVTEQNLLQFKTLNMSYLPVRYSEKFYRELLTNTPKEFIKFGMSSDGLSSSSHHLTFSPCPSLPYHDIAVWNGFSIGAVCSRLEPHSEKGFNKIYIMTIGVIPAYRRRGIGNEHPSYLS